MKKVLITGGAGFIGSHLTKAVLKQNFKVFVIDNLDSFYSPLAKEENIKKFIGNKNFSFKKLDIRSRDKIINLFEQQKFHYVIHLAAMAGVPNSIKNPYKYTNVNVLGTVNLLDGAIKNKVKKFIFASSSSVYGDTSQVPFSEDDPCIQPLSPYAASKRAGELLCYTYNLNFNLPIVILRLFTVYGSGQRPIGMAIQKFIKLIVQNKPLPIFGDGSMSRDYTYINDIVKGIFLSMSYTCRFEIFNLGNSHPVNLLSLVKVIEKVTKKGAKIKFVEKPKTEVTQTWANIQKAEKILKWKPKIKLEEGIKKQYEWFLNQPYWYKKLPV